MNLGKESETLEFKKTTGELKESMYDIAAMLNKHGEGTLYFGVNNEGNVVGQNVSASSLDDVARVIKEAIKPMIYPSIKEEFIDGLSIIKVEFTGTERPYSAYGRYYKKVFDRAEEMTPDELKHMMLNTDYSSIWEKSPTIFGLDAVDSLTLKSFYDKSVANGRFAPMAQYDEEKLLTILGLYKDGKLNNAGYYLFSNQEPIVLKMCVYVTDAMINYSDISRIHGNIYNLIEIATNYISQHMNWRVEFDDFSPTRVSTARKEIPEVPMDAIREIVVNSFAHANYRSITEHRVVITPSFIDIYNPGEFPMTYKPEDFANYLLESMPRNRKILEILYKSKDVEVQGGGIRKVLESCKNNGNKYEYFLMDLGFRFRFYRKNTSVESIENTKIVQKNKPKPEEMVLSVLRIHPDYTREQLVSQTGFGSRTIQRYLDNLKQDGLIVRRGSKKNGYWEIIDKK